MAEPGVLVIPITLGMPSAFGPIISTACLLTSVILFFIKDFTIKFLVGFSGPPESAVLSHT